MAVVADEKRMVKVDNAHKAMSVKVTIRRNVMAEVSEPRVFDAFAGRGEYYKAVWREAADYTGCDVRYFPDERRAYVADNKRVLRSIDLDAFNIFDLDAYGSPWEQATIIAARRKLKPGERVGMIFTEGLGLKYRMNGVPSVVTQLIGLKSGIAGLNGQRDQILAAVVSEIARRMGGEVVKRWQAKGRTGQEVVYMGVLFWPPGVSGDQVHPDILLVAVGEEHSSAMHDGLNAGDFGACDSDTTLHGRTPFLRLLKTLREASATKPMISMAHVAGSGMGGVY